MIIRKLQEWKTGWRIHFRKWLRWNLFHTFVEREFLTWLRCLIVRFIVDKISKFTKLMMIMINCFLWNGWPAVFPERSTVRKSHHRDFATHRGVTSQHIEARIGPYCYLCTTVLVKDRDKLLLISLSLCRCFRANDIREKTEKLQYEINQLDMDLEEHHGKISCFN